MTTQPTPEQLKAWRVKFESRYDLSQLGTVYDRYLNQDVREAWGNYVEAREDALQEFENVISYFKLNDAQTFWGSEEALRIKELIK